MRKPEKEKKPEKRDEKAFKKEKEKGQQVMKHLRRKEH